MVQKADYEPFEEKKDPINLDNLKYSKTRAQNYPQRFHTETRMQDHTIETIIRNLGNHKIHRTTTIKNQENKVQKRISTQIQTNKEINRLDRKNIKTFLNNYSLHQIHNELPR